jgi:polyisoprenoid-binding protein YceI
MRIPGSESPIRGNDTGTPGALKERDGDAYALVERRVPPFHISLALTIWRAERLPAHYSSRMTARLSWLVIAAWIPAAVAAPRTFAIDGNASSATAHVGKTGIGSFAGHEHTVVADTIQGEVVLDLEELSRSSVDLIVNARSLGVSEEGEPEGDAPKVQQAMRGPNVLDVARHGTIRFHSVGVTGRQIAPSSYELTLVGELTLHGVTKAFTVPVRLEAHGDTLSATGRMVVKQTDFGIEPTSAAGGLVRVEDEVVLTFRIGARAGL